MHQWQTASIYVAEELVVKTFPVTEGWEIRKAMGNSGACFIQDDGLIINMCKTSFASLLIQ